MPRGDGTGPNGMGPMTGRAAGYCAGYNVPGFANPAGGYGRGRGFGWGRGFGRARSRGMGWARSWPGQAYTPVGAEPEQIDFQSEMNQLKQQAQYLKTSLDELNQRIQELEK